MIKKIQSYLNLVLILFAIVGVIYFVIALIANMFKTEKYVTDKNLNEYMVSENLVTSYSIFNLLEKCTSNLSEPLILQDYEAVYEIIGKKTKKQCSKEEILAKIANISENILGFNNIMEGHSIWLNKAYSMDNGYIAEIKSTYTEQTVHIIFNLDLYDLTYTIDLIM